VEAYVRYGKNSKSRFWLATDSFDQHLQITQPREIRWYCAGWSRREKTAEADTKHPHTPTSWGILVLFHHEMSRIKGRRPPQSDLVALVEPCPNTNDHSSRHTCITRVWFIHERRRGGALHTCTTRVWFTHGFRTTTVLSNHKGFWFTHVPQIVLVGCLPQWWFGLHMCHLAGGTTKSRFSEHKQFF